MTINPYLYFNGECATAFKFYESCFNGRIVVMQTHGDSPMKEHVPVDWHDKVIHARLEVGDAVLLGSDAPPPHYGMPKRSTTIPKPADQNVFSNGILTVPFCDRALNVRSASCGDAIVTDTSSPRGAP